MRAAFDYGRAGIGGNGFPDGNLDAVTLSLEGLYYRGTDKLTGYIGAGILYDKRFLRLSDTAEDSLWSEERISDYKLLGHLGLRVTLGLRFGRDLSLELAVSEIRPRLYVKRLLSENVFSEADEQIRLHTVRLTLGYLFTLKPRP